MSTEPAAAQNTYTLETDPIRNYLNVRRPQPKRINMKGIAMKHYSLLKLAAACAAALGITGAFAASVDRVVVAQGVYRLNSQLQQIACARASRSRTAKLSTLRT